jgi:hypothetical protein
VHIRGDERQDEEWINLYIGYGKVTTAHWRISLGGHTFNETIYIVAKLLLLIYHSPGF